MNDGLIRLGLIAFGLYQLGLGIFQVAAPGVFFEEVGPFGERNDHYIRDTATFTLAAGVAVLASVRLVSWRVPLLAFAVLQFAFHTVNHVVDVNEAEPGWVGVFDAVSLAIGTLLLWVLLRAARRREAPAAGGRAG